jgi:hypothetical protein
MSMKQSLPQKLFLPACLVLVLGVTLIPLEAQGASCSTARTAGKWAYTYTGTLFTASGPIPVASVGHFFQTVSGDISGSQARSVAGSPGTEDIAGSITVNRDCTATATIAVYVNGQLQRTAVLAVVFDNNMNHARGIFQSLVLPDGTNVPVVITSDNSRLFSKE